MRTSFLKFYDNVITNWPTFSKQWEQDVFPYKIISAVISLILLGVVIYLIILIRKEIKESLLMVTESIDAPEVPQQRIMKQWDGIVRKLASDDPDSYKMAIIEADKIFDDLLKRIGYQGEDMGERLKQITPAQVANIQQVWAAHKVRNRIAHEPDFYLTKEDAIRAIEAYERAFEDLELL